jgi:hypothetical protein
MPESARRAIGLANGADRTPVSDRTEFQTGSQTKV